MTRDRFFNCFDRIIDIFIVFLLGPETGVIGGLYFSTFLDLFSLCYGHFRIVKGRGSAFMGEVGWEHGLY